MSLPPYKPNKRNGKTALLTEDLLKQYRAGSLSVHDLETRESDPDGWTRTERHAMRNVLDVIRLEKEPT